MSLANINPNPRTLDENHRNWQRFGTVANELLRSGLVVPADLATGGSDTQVLTITGSTIGWANSTGGTGGSGSDFFNF